MDDRYGECLDFVLSWEGGYTDGKTGASKFDRGGATNYGITQSNYDTWRIAQGLGRSPVAGITHDEVRAIYSDGYWNACRCDHLPEPVDAVVFDSAVNCGPAQAAKWLQRALGAMADGRIGAVTLGALKDASPVEVAKKIIDQRSDHYAFLVEHHPEQSVFLKGWNRRLDSLRSFCE